MTTITAAQFAALRPTNDDLIVTERDGEYLYETVVDVDGNEIAFASYKGGEAVGFTLVERDA